jgi:hypothetical protein
MVLTPERHISGKGFDPAEAALEDAFDGAKLRFNDLGGENGILTHSGPVTQSLLHRIISVDLEHFENELKTADWGSIDEADAAVAALVECIVLGMDPTPIKLQIIARSSGKNRELLKLVTEALNHSTFTTNYKGKNDSGKGKGSPLRS